MTISAKSKERKLNGRAVGRASLTNSNGRYERYQLSEFDDGWPGQEADQPPLRTEVREEQIRKAISWNSSPDLPFDRSVNPYRGCEHGCIYCFARPGHAWLGMSPGLDFETRLIARPTISEALENEISKSTYSPKPIAIGTFTDPYQPVEKTYEIMRDILKTLIRFNHPVAIVTKGTLIERDIDLLAELARKNLVRVGVSVTSLDRKVARTMEPRVPPPSRRLAMIKALSQFGIPVRIMASPLVPGLTDHELEGILSAGRASGASAASWIMLRLPQEVSPLFQEWLLQHYPTKSKKVMSLIREMHGGNDYVSDWGHRMRGQGAYAELVNRRFKVAIKRLELNEDLSQFRTDLFRVPVKAGDQYSLF